MHAGYPQRPEEGVRSPGAGVVSAGAELRPSAGAASTEPSLQSLKVLIKP